MRAIHQLIASGDAHLFTKNINVFFFFWAVNIKLSSGIQYIWYCNARQVWWPKKAILQDNL